jgi:hypothetical protein
LNFETFSVNYTGGGNEYVGKNAVKQDAEIQHYEYYTCMYVLVL